MKLLFCPHCHDVRKLHSRDHDLLEASTTRCKCGKSWGYYMADELNAVYGGDAVMLGINNHSLAHAIVKNKAQSGVRDEVGGPVWGHNVTAFIIPESAPSVRREQPPQGEPKP